MHRRFGVTARRALMLLPFLGSVASAQATLGGLDLRGTGAGFAIADNATRSSSITVSGFTQFIAATATNQTVVVRINGLTHTYAGDLIAQVSFASASLGSTFTWTLFALPGLQTDEGNFGSRNFNGNYSFGEYDEASTLFTGDLIDAVAFSPSVNVGSGDYFAFDGQDYGSPGATFGGLDPDGVWTLSINDVAPPDIGAITSWDLAFNTASASVVPEPSSVVLMATGLLALGAAARRRRKV